MTSSFRGSDPPASGRSSVSRRRTYWKSRLQVQPGVLIGHEHQGALRNRPRQLPQLLAHGGRHSRQHDARGLSVEGRGDPDDDARLRRGRRGAAGPSRATSASARQPSSESSRNSGKTIGTKRRTRPGLRPRHHRVHEVAEGRSQRAGPGRVAPLALRPSAASAASRRPGRRRARRARRASRTRPSRRRAWPRQPSATGRAKCTRIAAPTQGTRAPSRPGTAADARPRHAPAAV